jgi:hypothetical protein
LRERAGGPHRASLRAHFGGVLPPEIEEQVDELYGLPPEEFTARRNEIAKELRGDGRRADADEVRGLAKPTQPAWVVNQLARGHRRDVDLLLDAGHRLRRVQAGGRETREQLDDAVRAEREALQRLLTAARQILGERGKEPSGAVLERVSRTLRAASASDEGRELLARGRLSSELEASGFDLLAPFAGDVPGPTRRPRQRNARAAKAGKREEVKAARDRADAAGARTRDVKKQLTTVERDLAAARREAERLSEHADEIRAELEAAGRAEQEAREELRRLQRRSGAS